MNETEISSMVITEVTTAVGVMVMHLVTEILLISKLSEGVYAHHF